MHRELVSTVLVALFATVVSRASAESSLRDSIPKGVSSQPVVAAPDPIAGVATQIAPSQVDLASAAVSTKEKGTEFKATFVPAKLFDTGYVDVLSESKIVLTSDGTLTRFGYGVAYNPFALRSDRAAEIVGLELHKKGCGKALADSLDTLDLNVKPLKEEVERAKQKFEDADVAYSRALQLSDPAVDAIKAERERAKAALDEAQKALDKAKKKGTDDADAALIKCNNELTVEEWRKINSGWTPLVSLNLAVDVYPFGKGPDPDDATKKARLQPFGGFKADAGLTFKPQERFSFDLWGQVRRGRSSGDPKTELATYAGGGVTVSGVVWAFLADFTKSSDYVQTGFIPGLVVGTSAQYSKCWGNENCDKMRTESMSMTPFVDIRIKAALQFRLSAPITKFTGVGEDGTDVAPTLTFATAVAAI